MNETEHKLDTGYDSTSFRSGTEYSLYSYLGAHPAADGHGTVFAVYAPGAQSVSLCIKGSAPLEMTRRDDGIWQCFAPGARCGDAYSYAVLGADGVMRQKSDPMAFQAGRRPDTASVVCSLSGYRWHDKRWMNSRCGAAAAEKPLAVYEFHPGSWKKDYSADPDGFINYRILADELTEYLRYMGYTHVELIGICEHPFDGSWGYQVSGFFAPTSRHGSPDDFRYFVDTMHRAGIGVILDWVPAHFPKDDFALGRFDGTALYESADELMAEYPQWGTYAFDHSKGEVRSFLISSAMYWINEFHVDALRIDAVAAMLNTSFGRSCWRTAPDGSDENRAGIAFLRQLNSTVTENSSAFTIAEDSSIRSGITVPVSEGGLGFGFKWNMGWMNETLRYIGTDPIYRQYHHDLLTHPGEYAFLEHFLLPLSHDEVVHLKRSMLMKNPGSMPDKLGALKTLYTYMFTFPGKKLLFMGQEFAVEDEWSESRALNWALAEEKWHRDVMDCVRALLKLYKKYPALYSDPQNPAVLEWVQREDRDHNTAVYIRRNPWNYDGALLVVMNFSPVELDYYAGTPMLGRHRRIFSTYDTIPDRTEPKLRLASEETLCCGYRCRLHFTLRPYESAVFAIPASKTN